MFTKELTYTDYDNKVVTETLYFHYTKAEMIKLEASVPGGFTNKLLSLMGIKKEQATDSDIVDKHLQEKKVPEMVNLLEEFILNGYGKRTENGGFIKNQQIKEEFKCSEAYSALFIELMTDAKECAAFFKELIPEFNNAKEITAK